MIAHTILYVADQNRSTELYRAILAVEPILNVPGMTEFKLSEGHILGLMPEAGIKRLLGDRLPDPSKANGTPRVELYIRVDHPEVFHARALTLGCQELSPIQDRPWGDRAGYAIDPDGHILSFATTNA